MRTFLEPVVLVLLALPAAADTITGRVVDANGNGVPGVDIDAKNLGGGGNPALFNDGTDANGFFTTTIPAGVYRITFIPPPPPTTTHLVLEVEPVVVIGTTSMGTIALAPGASVGGHVQRANGTPVASVNIDVLDQATGNVLVTANDLTDVFGNFLVAVPRDSIELRLDATPVFGTPLASVAFALAPTANVTLSTTVLQPGFVLTGAVQDQAGSAVPNADLDVFDAPTHAKLFTPGDDTTSTGAFSIVVPAGTFDLEICPDPAQRLVATGLASLPVATHQNLGLFRLEPGAVLSGVVKNAAAQPVASVNLGVKRSSNGSKVFVCNNNTDAAGKYSVIVPFATIDVTFRPDFSLPLGALTVANVIVTGARTLNATLPNCPFSTNYGAGLAGTGARVPHLTASGGAPSVQNAGWRIEMQGGRGGATAILVLSLNQASTPLLGGTLLVSLAAGQHFVALTVLSGAPGVAGAGAASFAPGSLAGAAGFTGYAQFAVRDPAAPRGWALSEGLRTTFCN